VVNDLGWIATAVFVASYLFSHPLALRLAQMIGAALWISYGVFIHALPVIAANALVFVAAAWTTWRAWRKSERRVA
jgi:O-antigen ligase